MDNANVMTDHDEIRKWAEEHNAKPEIVETGAMPIIRLDFPGKDDDVFLPENAKKLDGDWGAFFEFFEKQNLALELDDSVADPSLAYRFVKRDIAEED